MGSLAVLFDSFEARVQETTFTAAHITMEEKLAKNSSSSAKKTLNSTFRGVPKVKYSRDATGLSWELNHELTMPLHFATNLTVIGDPTAKFLLMGDNATRRRASSTLTYAAVVEKLSELYSGHEALVRSVVVLEHRSLTILLELANKVILSWRHGMSGYISLKRAFYGLREPNDTSSLSAPYNLAAGRRVNNLILGYGPRGVDSSMSDPIVQELEKHLLDLEVDPLEAITCAGLTTEVLFSYLNEMIRLNPAALEES